MRAILYPGAANQPCQVDYGVSITRDDAAARANIVVIDSRDGDPHHTPILNTPAGRDLILNKILSTDLQSIRIDLTRFFVLVDAGPRLGINGYEYRINLDFEDYQRKGHPVLVRNVVPTSLKGWLKYLLGFYVKTVTALNRDVVGGRATVKAGLDKVRVLTDAESRALVTAVGYEFAAPTKHVRPAILATEKTEINPLVNAKLPKYLH
jgi:hypothetical protein